MRPVCPVIAALLGSLGQAHAIEPENLNNITFQNGTGMAIEYVFLSPGDSEYWGTDILGANRVLDNGDSLGFFIHYPKRCNDFDIMAVAENRDAYTIYDYEICDGEEAVIQLSRHNLDETAPAFEFTEITLENQLSYEIWYMFFSPADSEMWGVDQLDENSVLAPGDSLSVLLPIGAREVRYDVQAVDQDEDTYTFYVELDNSKSSYLFAVEPADLDD